MAAGSQDRFGIVARTFHWAIALLVLALLSVGFFMTGMEFSPQKLEIYGLHKSFGILVLMLAALRLVWRWTHKPPPALETHQKWEKSLSKFIHFALYAVIFAMPLSGWLMSSAGDFRNSFFGLFEMPDLVAKDQPLFKIMRDVHGWIAYAIIALVGLHVAGAFKHHFIDRDETLKRMTYGRMGLGGGAVLAVLAFGLLAAPIILTGLDYMNEQAPDNVVAAAVAVDQESRDIRPAMQNPAVATVWNIDKAQSTIRFEATQYGEVFSGEFKNFDGQITFDEANLAASRADITIDISSIDTGSDERDGQARDAEWFDIVQYPQARFTSSVFESLGGNRYQVSGNLTIRGLTMPVSFPFVLQIAEAEHGPDFAQMDADLSLNRLDFGVGQGQWANAETIGNEVKLTIHVMAEENITAPE